MTCPKCKKESYYDPFKRKWNKRRCQLEITCTRCGYKADDSEFTPKCPEPSPLAEFVLGGRLYIIKEKK